MTKAKKYLKKLLSVVGKPQVGRVVRISTGVCVLPLVVILSYHLLFWQRIYLGVEVGRLYLGGKTELEARSLLVKVTPPPAITIIGSTNKLTLDTSTINVSHDATQTARNAFLVGRLGNLGQTTLVKWKGLKENITIPLVISFDGEKLRQIVDDTAVMLSTPPAEPKITIQKNTVKVDPGRVGQEVDQDIFLKRIEEALTSGKSEVAIPFKTVGEQLTPSQVEQLTSRAQKLAGTTLTLTLNEQTRIIQDQQLMTLLKAQGGYDSQRMFSLVEEISRQFSGPPQEPLFRFEGGRVVEFKPAKAGIEVKKEELVTLIVRSIAALEERNSSKDPNQTFTLPVIRTPPKIKTGEVNNLGIRELLGRGTSRFRGSIPSRAYNISLAASRINGILIPPGEVFSFNQALGDVSAFTGYKQAYIIKDGKTILGDGGGVCQVSTTLFRAALKVGLTMVERRAHSYRVAYYEQDSGPGFDATVYAPSPDLQIKNDTPAHVLIQAIADTKNQTLTFELYGTSDGRVATTTKPRVWDVVSPPPDLYQDDPTLPLGKIKQVDFKAWGAKVAIDYKVVRGGEVLQDRTFYSVYRPWQAVYLRGIAK